MTQDDDEDRPGPYGPGSSRSLTPKEVEAVVRRAVELESFDDQAPGKGVSPDEMVRIGEEVGLEPATLHRAMVEVLAGPEEGNVVLRAMGARCARGERLVPESVDRVGPRIDEHLREGEFMVPARRFPGVAEYTRDSTFAAFIGRIKRRFTRSRRPLAVERVDVTTTVVDEEATLVAIAADLRGPRIGFAIAALATGVPLATIVFATNPVTSPWMLLGIPLLVGPWYFFRAIYGTVRRRTEERVEALLDSIAHDDPP